MKTTKEENASAYSLPTTGHRGNPIPGLERCLLGVVVRSSPSGRRSEALETPFPGRPRVKTAGGTGAAALATRVTQSALIPVLAMASFVTEVLAHSGRLEKEDLGTRISRLTRRVEEIKVRAGQLYADWKGTTGPCVKGLERGVGG